MSEITSGSDHSLAAFAQRLREAAPQADRDVVLKACKELVEYARAMGQIPRRPGKIIGRDTPPPARLASRIEPNCSVVRSRKSALVTLEPEETVARRFIVEKKRSRSLRYRSRPDRSSAFPMGDRS